MIISLAWFHNLFSWDLCYFRGNWLKRTILKYYATDSPGANPYFLLFIYRGLTRFRCSYLNSWFMLFFRNNYPSWKTSIVGICNFYSLIFFIQEYVGRNEKIFFLFWGENLNLLCFSSIEACIIPNLNA